MGAARARCLVSDCRPSIGGSAGSVFSLPTPSFTISTFASSPQQTDNDRPHQHLTNYPAINSRWVTPLVFVRALAYVLHRSRRWDEGRTQSGKVCSGRRSADGFCAQQYAFSRDFRKKGMIALGTYLRQYKYVHFEHSRIEHENG